MVSLALAPRRRRYWFDPRVAIGVALVLASVAGVVLVVAATDRTVTVYAAASPLAAGSRVASGDLVPTHVRLGSAQSLYLAGHLPAAGFVATRSIAQGEIVPLSALGTAASVDTASIVLSLGAALPGSVVDGSSVDLWAAPKTAASTYGPPVVLVSGATVVRVVQQSGLVASGNGTTVEVRVPRDTVPQVLESIADDDEISAVGISEPVSR